MVEERADRRRRFTGALTRKTSWATPAGRRGYRVAWLLFIALMAIATAQPRHPRWTTWRIAAFVVLGLAGVLLALNALAVRRMRGRGEWPPPTRPGTLPPSQPDEAYLVTLRRWLRSHRAS